MRMIAVFILAAVFGFVPPAVLAPIGRNWGVLMVSFATFAICVGFSWDGLRMAGRLHR
jgi:hypothetical protein